MAAPDQLLEQRRLTFSQEQGLATLPSQLKLGELSAELRSVLWVCIVHELECTRVRNYYGRVRVSEVWETILRDAHVFLYHKPADEFDASFDELVDQYETLIWSNIFNEVVDFLQFVMRHPVCEHRFIDQVRSLLEYCKAAYVVLDGGPTFVPIGSKEEVKTLIDAFAATKHPAFSGAGTHLRLAVEALNTGRYGDSVRESVHAVESAARVLSEDAKATLTPAVQQLETRLRMHPAFKRALVSLYGYTSDEAGIRHSLLDDETRVDMHDALFMLRACASFVTFLIGKGRTAGMISG